MNDHEKQRCARAAAIDRLESYYLRELVEDAQDGSEFDCAILDLCKDLREHFGIVDGKPEAADWDRKSASNAIRGILANMPGGASASIAKVARPLQTARMMRLRDFPPYLDAIRALLVEAFEGRRVADEQVTQMRRDVEGVRRIFGTAGGES